MTEGRTTKETEALALTLPLPPFSAFIRETSTCG